MAVDHARPRPHQRAQALEVGDHIRAVAGRDPQVAVRELARPVRQIPVVGVRVQEHQDRPCRAAAARAGCRTGRCRPRPARPGNRRDRGSRRPGRPARSPGPPPRAHCGRQAPDPGARRRPVRGGARLPVRPPARPGRAREALRPGARLRQGAARGWSLRAGSAGMSPCDDMHRAYHESSESRRRRWKQPNRRLTCLGAAALAISAAVWETCRMEPSDAAALNVVLAEPGISIKGLARTLGLTHSATVRVADRLTLGGLVTRDPAGPGRTVALTSTPRGKSLASQAAARRMRVLEHATSGLTAAQRQDLITSAGRGGPPARRRPGADRPGMPPVRPEPLPPARLPAARLNPPAATSPAPDRTGQPGAGLSRGLPAPAPGAGPRRRPPGSGRSRPGSR